MPTAELTTETISRLQNIAVPLIDTFDTVVSRLLDHWEFANPGDFKGTKPGVSIGTAEDGRTMLFDPARPPQLNFTSPKQIIVDGTTLNKGLTYWNSMMIYMILQAHRKGHEVKDICASLFINAHEGQKSDGGYKFLDGINLSVQGQDSNAAFRQSYELAKLYNIPFQVWFRWQENDKAAYPSSDAILEYKC